MPEKVIRDSIHGNIPCDPVAVRVMDSQYMQRLRNVKQNGLCYLVYPAMNSTRFEHCLGVYHLSRLLCSHMGLSESQTIHVSMAALLHDVGHGPLSHTFDSIFSRYGLEHEKISCEKVCSTEISDILSEAGVRPGEVAELIRGNGRLGKLISSEVDIDKMDYLVRDAHYAGVAYGITDVERLLYSLSLRKKDVIVESSGLEAAESLLINRSMMYRTVYRHHTKRIAESMMSHAVKCAIDRGLDPDDLMRMDDIGLVCMLRGLEGYPQRIMRMIDRRRLFGCVFSQPILSFEECFRSELSKDPQKIQKKISDELGVDDGYLLLDWPESSMNEYRVLVRTPHGLAMIDEVSALARSLMLCEQERLTVNLYLEQGQKKKMEGFDPLDYFRFEQTRLWGFS